MNELPIVEVERAYEPDDRALQVLADMLEEAAERRTLTVIQGRGEVVE